MLDQDIGESVARWVAEKAREDIQRLGSGGKRMGLLVGHHLQTMLDGPQEVVSSDELVPRLCIDPAVGRQCRECDEGTAVAQLRMPSAGDQLLGLDKEFDLANATPSELYVVAFDGDFAMTSIGMGLPLHFMNIRNRGVIEIFAPDEWRQIAEKLFAGADVAGASARLDQRRAFPVLTAALVIVERGGVRNCNLGRRGIRPQSQIDAEYVSIGGTRLQDFDQIARH